MKEIWKTIKGFNDYQISNKGRVKSFKGKKAKILVNTFTKKYCKDKKAVKLFKNGIGYPFMINRLLYFCFGIGNINENEIHLSEFKLESRSALLHIKKILGEK